MDEIAFIDSVSNSETEKDSPRVFGLCTPFRALRITQAGARHRLAAAPRIDAGLASQTLPAASESLRRAYLPGESSRQRFKEAAAHIRRGIRALPPEHPARAEAEKALVHLTELERLESQEGQVACSDRAYALRWTVEHLDRAIRELRR